METQHELDELHFVDIESREIVLNKLEAIIHYDVSTDVPAKEAAIYMLESLNGFIALYHKIVASKSNDTGTL